MCFGPVACGYCATTYTLSVVCLWHRRRWWSSWRSGGWLSTWGEDRTRSRQRTRNDGQRWWTHHEGKVCCLLTSFCLSCSNGSMPIAVHHAFHETSPFCPVYHESLQGADILVAPVHQIVSLSPFWYTCLVVAIRYDKNNLLNQPIILRLAHPTKEVQFSLHSLHNVDAYTHSFYNVLHSLFPSYV